MNIVCSRLYIKRSLTIVQHPSTDSLVESFTPDVSIGADIKALEPKTFESERWLLYLNQHLPDLHADALSKASEVQTRQKSFYDPSGKVKYVYHVRYLMKRRKLESKWLFLNRVNLLPSIFWLRTTKSVLLG
ncbi:uncharacterized protein EV154DRAFT_481886 [Mucor mucedo]|uniref:uncharacterized protein n=1 Tax=Mucor mucedo TaxID=29922 RepID=UPI0022201667|nr:uncharacterized protein EV154DRAFT_481886 [Mucor mucedo]KAI7890757.1 hypothetical protein EV154DRAFT_481886 [Mucor mucedo]